MCKEIAKRRIRPATLIPFTTFMPVDLRFEYKGEVSLIGETPKFEGFGEVEAREVRVWVTGTLSSHGPARV